MELLIITGMSGAGKSKAVACMEDLGYYCVDNLPPMMLPQLLDHLKKDPSIEKVAFVADIRGRDFFKDLGTTLAALDAGGTEYKIMFLEASDRVLLMRYQETRRSHPLAKDGNTEKGIKLERTRLDPIRAKASYIIDTSELKVAELNAEIKRLLVSDDSDLFRVSVSSFGYKYGLPTEADWVLDVRFIPNPYYVASLKKLTGKNKKVKEFVLGFEETKDFVAKITGMILDLIPRYTREGKYHLSVAFGCTGGQHRSVVIAEEVAKHLAECGQAVSVTHREQDSSH